MKNLEILQEKLTEHQIMVAKLWNILHFAKNKEMTYELYRQIENTAIDLINDDGFENEFWEWQKEIVNELK